MCREFCAAAACWSLLEVACSPQSTFLKLIAPLPIFHDVHRFVCGDVHRSSANTSSSSSSSRTPAGSSSSSAGSSQAKPPPTPQKTRDEEVEDELAALKRKLGKL